MTKYVGNFCGSRRVPNGRGLPIYAWKVNNDTQIADDEMLIRVVKIHLENGSFNQIYSEVGGNEEKMKETVMEIVKQRGKMHNPYTGTGGLFGGIVEKIGKNFDNADNIRVGDEVIVPVSIAMLPLKLKRVKSVNYVYNHLNVDGYTVIYSGCPVVKKTPDISWDILLSAFEESASIKKASGFAEGKSASLVIGSNPIVTMLYGLALRSVMAPDGILTCVHYGDNAMYAYNDIEQNRNKLLYSVFDEVYFMSTRDPMECIDETTEGGERLYDVIVNCADQMGAEAISVIAAKENGNVLFSNLTNNYTTALLVQEAINRDINLFCAVGYVEGYYDYMMSFIRSVSDKLIEIGKILTRISDSSKRRIHTLPEEMDDTCRIDEILNVKSKAMAKSVIEIQKAAKYDCSVILTGESGTGKEVAANLIYRMSSRKNGPFVKVNCAAIPKELMESEFFGYERCVYRRKGKRKGRVFRNCRRRSAAAGRSRGNASGTSSEIAESHTGRRVLPGGRSKADKSGCTNIGIHQPKSCSNGSRRRIQGRSLLPTGSTYDKNTAAPRKTRRHHSAGQCISRKIQRKIWHEQVFYGRSGALSFGTYVAGKHKGA